MSRQPADIARERGPHNRVTSAILEAAREGTFTAESIAMLLASITVDEVRAAWWTINEGAAAFAMHPSVFRRHVLALGIKPVKFRGRAADGGGRAFVPKIQFMQAMLHAAGGPEPSECTIYGPLLDPALKYRPRLKERLDDFERRLLRIEQHLALEPLP